MVETARMRRTALLGFCLALLACSGERAGLGGLAPAPSAVSVECSVALRKGTMRVVVEHDGDEVWARNVADRACAFLPVAEAYFDMPFHEAAASMFHDVPSPWTVRIVGRARVMLGDVHIGAYNNTSGVFGPDRAIFVEYGLAPVGNPAVILHELSHDWVRGRGAVLKPGAPRDDNAPSWFLEGIASLAPIEMSATGRLALPKGEEHAMRKHWGQWDVPTASNDVAIVHDPRRDGRIPIFYGKSYRVQLLVEREIGADGYRALLHAIALHSPATNDEALALLAAQKGDVDWRAFLSGWVFDGPYRNVAPVDVPRLLPPAPSN
jgi:hypothetical protein